MRRRHALKMVGGSVPFLPLISSAAVAEKGSQPIGGQPPNDNVPRRTIHAFPEEVKTLPTGLFLELRNGWIFPECTRAQQMEFFDKTRQTFVYDGQTFVLESFDDWEPYEVKSGRFLFSHTDPPKPHGTTFQVTWDTIYTADFDNPCVDSAFEEGDRHAGFPFESSYEIIARGRRE